MSEHLLVRRAERDDEAAVTELAVVNGMFGADEVGELVAMFRGAVEGELGDHRWLVAVAPPDDRVVAAAYLAPEPFADRLWNLYFLAVSPTQHGRGVGSHLVRHLEAELRHAGERVARILVVETSSTEQYAGARAFYRARGFGEEARIREFYGPGDDKVVFWKALTVDTPPGSP